MHIRKGITVFFFSSFLFSLSFNSYAQDTFNKVEYRAFANDMVQKYHYNKHYITETLAKAVYLPEVLQHIQQPLEQKPWGFYKNYFVNQNRIDLGTQYWTAHNQTFDNVKEKFGVDSNVIIAILGIETLYGQEKGKYQEIGALATLAFNYAPRSNFFKNELRQFIALVKQDHLPLEIYGSYAGALGIPQFMPSSYLHYGVDYSKNNKVDLLANHEDAIASIANYLKANGWHTNQPVAIKVEPTKKIPLKMLSYKAIKKLSIQQLLPFGIHLPNTISSSQKVGLIQLKNGETDEYWVVFPNFKAIMSYNPNLNYAMAVYALSQEIKNNHDKSRIT